MAQVVFKSAGGNTTAHGLLFDHLKFWLSANVPSRKTITEYIETNGGSVVREEMYADIKLVDHMRKAPPQGSYSYQFVEFSVRKGELEDLELHRIGQTGPTSREAGSISRSGKSHRTQFTAEDDSILIRWVLGSVQTGGGRSGNEIYKQLEQHNGRHTWQSWRDRFLRVYKDKSDAALQQFLRLPIPPVEGSVQARHPVTRGSSVPESVPATAMGATTLQRRKKIGKVHEEQQQQEEEHEQEKEQEEKAAQQESTKDYILKHDAVLDDFPEAGEELDEEEEEDDEETVAVDDQRPAVIQVTTEVQDGMQFDDEDRDALLVHAKSIYAMHESRTDEAWESWSSRVRPSHLILLMLADKL